MDSWLLGSEVVRPCNMHSTATKDLPIQHVSQIHGMFSLCEPYCKVYTVHAIQYRKMIECL